MNLMPEGRNLSIEKKEFASGFALYYQLATGIEAKDLNKILMMSYYSSHWTEVGLGMALDKQVVFLTQFFHHPIELNVESSLRDRFMAGVSIWRDAISGSMDKINTKPSYQKLMDEQKLESNIRKKILTLL